MCTVTIRRGPEDLLVTMNRDERWTRDAERPPTLHPAGPGRPAWMAPPDGERCGTWIGANDAGVVACLLNGYAPGDLDLFARPDVPSRGEIIPALLGYRPEAASGWIRDGLGASRGRLAPHHLLLLACRRGRGLAW